MRAVVQRVASASVSVGGQTVGAIERGLLVYLGVATGDGPADTEYIAAKLAGLRIFEDEAGKMNRSVTDTGGAILLISQFTLAGDARGGRRPSFITAERPEAAKARYDDVAAVLRAAGLRVETGIFQTDMQVASVNDGPVTILLDSTKLF
jgi:D-tyrosyl-tRNA(Tyr) deacylase